MDVPKNDPPKLPDMVMCGDHPSITKTELNVKTDPKMDEKEKDKLKEKVLSYAKITPSDLRWDLNHLLNDDTYTNKSVFPEVIGKGVMNSRTERNEQAKRTERTERSERGEARARSDHVMRLSEARRRVRSLEVVRRPDVDVQATGNRALVQAALGSFRWPPYLLCVWVLVLVLTHVLHCLVCLLERALPALRNCSQFFRSWTEASWRGELEIKHRAFPVALALVTALLHALYYTLYAAYAIVLWAIEPLCAETEEKLRITQEMLPKVTNYEDELKNDSS